MWLIVKQARYQLCVDVQSVLRTDQWGELLLGDLRAWSNATKAIQPAVAK